MSYAQIEALRAAQDHVREASEVLRGLAMLNNPRVVEAGEDALEYLAAATKRIEDVIRALNAPRQPTCDQQSTG